MEGRSRLGQLLIGLESKDVDLWVGKSAHCTVETRKDVDDLRIGRGMVDTTLPRKASKR